MGFASLLLGNLFPNAILGVIPIGWPIDTVEVVVHRMCGCGGGLRLAEQLAWSCSGRLARGRAEESSCTRGFAAWGSGGRTEVRTHDRRARGQACSSWRARMQACSLSVVEADELAHWGLRLDCEILDTVLVLLQWLQESCVASGLVLCSRELVQPAGGTLQGIGALAGPHSIGRLHDACHTLPIDLRFAHI